MRKMNLKLRIFIYFSIAAILPSLLFWSFLYARIDKKLEADYRGMVYTNVQTQITDVDEFFEKQVKIVNSIAKAYPYIDNSAQGISEFLQKQADINEHFLNIYIVTTKGVLISNTGKVITSTDFTFRMPYQNAIREQKLVWLEPYEDEISRVKTFGLATPIYNKNGSLEGVLVANLTFDFIQNIIANTELLSDSQIFLIDKAGEVKFTINNDFTEGSITDKNFISHAVSADILGKSKGVHDIVNKGSRWLCTFAEMPSTGWKIIVLYDYNKLAKNLGLMYSDIYRALGVFGAGVLLFVLFLAIYLSNSISRPLLKLRDGVQELSLGNLDQTITIKGMDEIKVVADTFNQMAYNLKNSYKDLFTRTEELYEKNEYLQEMNAELEASYEQLGATMEQLNESEEKYRKLVNNISDLVIVLNEDAEIVYVNSSVERVLKYTDTSLIGRKIRDILGNELNEDTLAACYADDYHEFQLRMHREDGNLLYLEGSTRRLIEHGRVVGVQAIVRDITQRKAMEEELHARYQEMQAINGVLSAVTTTLDLDNLLNIVIDEIIDSTGALCCTIGLYEGETHDDYKLKAVKGIRLKDKNQVSIEATKSRTLQQVENKKYFILELNENYLPNEYFKLLYIEEGARYVLFTPLVSQGKLIGLTSNFYRTLPNQELIELIISISNSVALSIDNAKAYEHVKEAYLKTVQSLVSTIEAKDMYTESHSIRVAKYASFIASELNMEKGDIEDIWVAGVLHDIGKIGISDAILNKKERLTDEEYRLVKQHPEIAYKILSNIGLGQSIMRAVKHHHERYDGKGYPDAIHGDNIDLMASIISVADSFDAITSERSYKQPKSLEEGIQELVACKGSQFNPLIVDTFTRAFQEKHEVFMKIHQDEEVKFF